MGGGKRGRGDRSATESGTDVDVHQKPKEAKAARERLVTSHRMEHRGYNAIIQTTHTKGDDGSNVKTLVPKGRDGHLYGTFTFRDTSMDLPAFNGDAKESVLLREWPFSDGTIHRCLAAMQEMTASSRTTVRIKRDGYCNFDVVHYTESDVLIWGSNSASDSSRVGVFPGDSLNDTPRLPMVHKMTGCFQPLHKLTGSPFPCDSTAAEGLVFSGHMYGGHEDIQLPHGHAFTFAEGVMPVPRGVYWPASHKIQTPTLRIMVGCVRSKGSTFAQFSHCLVLMKGNLTCFSKQEIDEAPDAPLPSVMQIGDEHVATRGDLGRVCFEAGLKGQTRANLAHNLIGLHVPFGSISLKIEDYLNRIPAVVPGVTVSWSIVEQSIKEIEDFARKRVERQISWVAAAAKPPALRAPPAPPKGSPSENAHLELLALLYEHSITKGAAMEAGKGGVADIEMLKFVNTWPRSDTAPNPHALW